MNDREFKELESIRTSIKENRIRIEEIDMDIGDLRREEHEILDPLRKSMEDKRFTMLNDKEQRDSFGIKNQTNWQKKIRDLTADEENKINNISEDFQIKRKALQDEATQIKNDIKDLQMEHANKLAYYSQIETQKVSIDFNVKDLVESSSK